ncbi:MAG: fibronectin type III domain-containing protein [Clostridia bacterium]|nr:fibronectin type III domain-containing protein [Clostridia bacterium]
MSFRRETDSLIVNTVRDVVDAFDGVTSLREAIAFAKEGETVTFDESMRDQTIILNGTQLILEKAVDLDAGDLNVTLDADGKSWVMSVNAGPEKSIYLNGLTFTNGGEHAVNSSAAGGLHHKSGILTVTDCVFQDNRGAGIVSWGDHLTVKNSIIERNEEDGIYYSGKKLTVSNSVIAGNGDDGISVFANNALMLISSTVVGNGNCGIDALSNAFTVDNSIVTANLGENDLNGKAKVTNSIVGSNDSANRDTLKNTQTGVRDPGFVDLPDFANYEEWLNAREEDWDLTLKAGSRAINAGDVKLFTKSGMPQTSSDLAGNARISGSKVDIGAYEYQSAFIETPDVEVVKSGKTLTVTWDAVYGASSYLVEYRDVKTAKWTAKTVKKGTSLAINGKVGTTYEIRVAAVTANGNSKAAVETVTVYAPLTTPKLKALKDFCKDDTFAVEVTNYAANLASAAESVTFGMNGIYETFKIENGSGNVRFASGEVVTFQNGTFTVTNAKANSQYKLEVMFSNPLTGSAFAKANVKTTKTTYLAPTNFRVTASTSNSITLDWSDSPAKTDASKYAEKYTVQYSTNGGKSWRSVSVKTSEATLTRLKSGTYLIRVLAAKDSKFEASLPTEILEFRL